MTAKKIASPKKNSGTEPSTQERGGRKKTYTPESLLGIQADFNLRFAEIKAVAKKMENSKVRSIEVDGFTQVDRALELMDKFIGNCERSFREARSRHPTTP